MIAIIDYGAGNLTSVERAVQYLGYDGKITANHAGHSWVRKRLSSPAWVRRGQQWTI